MRTYKIKLGYLPIFPGFYGTIFEPDMDACIERMKDEGVVIEDTSYIDFDFKDYHDRIGRKAAQEVEHQVKTEIHPDIDIEYLKIYSPKFYNYSNDKILVNYKASQEAIQQINKMIIENVESFKEFIKDIFKSRSGFISFYTSNWAQWLENMRAQIEENPIYIQYALEFLLNDVIGYSQEDLQSDTADENYIEVMNESQNNKVA